MKTMTIKRKSVLIIMVMAALMLWSPILAEAKGKNKKGHKHGKYGKPFAYLQDQIDANEGLIEDLDAKIDAHSNDSTIHGGSGGGSLVVNVVYEDGSTACTPANPQRPGPEQACLASCGPEELVVSGGYELSYSGATSFVDVYGSYPVGFGAPGGGWLLNVVNTDLVNNPETPLTVYAVCIGQ